jgi:hypothetical protein
MTIENYRHRLNQLKPYHPGDDDPTGMFYTVREQRRYCRDNIAMIKNRKKWED